MNTNNTDHRGDDCKYLHGEQAQNEILSKRQSCLLKNKTKRLKMTSSVLEGPCKKHDNVFLYMVREPRHHLLLDGLCRHGDVELDPG